MKNWALGMINEGMPDRAITRDIEWGVEVPVDDLGPGKRIYVWFDAVIGYLSAAKEWAQNSGDPEAWRKWWEDPEAESYYFVGKDNIPFHTVIWPAMLLGYGGLNLPTDVPANQYITFGSGQGLEAKPWCRRIHRLVRRAARARCPALCDRLGPPRAERHRPQ